MKSKSSTGSLKELLTAGEVGDRLRLPLSTVYYLAKAGKLRGIRLGRSWRFPANAIGRLQDASVPLILVVDAHKPTRSLVTRVLQFRGCRVAEADGVDAALAHTKQNHFDLLLLDLTVPTGNGGHSIRDSTDAFSPDQLVLMTPPPDLATAWDLPDPGAVALLPKPFTADALVACVERAAGMQLQPTTEAMP